MTLLISFRRKSSLEQSWPEASWKVTSLGFKFKTYEFIFKQSNTGYLKVHDSIKELENGVQDVCIEGTLIVSTLVCGPLLGLLVEEVLTPEPEIYKYIA